jgi:hypothetical protein
MEKHNLMPRSKFALRHIGRTYGEFNQGYASAAAGYRSAGGLPDITAENLIATKTKANHTRPWCDDNGATVGFTELQLSCNSTTNHGIMPPIQTRHHP